MVTHSASAARPSRAIVRLGLFLGSLLALAGCAELPVQELTQYREAFNQARQASEEVLLDFDQVTRLARAPSTPQAKTDGTGPYSLELRTEADAMDGTASADIEARRRALLVVSRYNDMLALLAEGKSVEAVSNSATGLLTSISKLREVVSGTGIPGLAAISGLLTTAFQLVEKARLRQEFVAAVEHGSVVIDKILDIFIKDDADHYKARAVLATRERVRILARQRNAGNSVAAIVGAHDVPAADVAAVTRRADAAFAVQKNELAVVRRPIASGGAGALAYSDVAKAQVEDELTELEALATAYQKNSEHMAAVRALLDEHIKLLRKTQKAFETVREALNRPQNPAVTVDELLEIAFNVRRQLEELKATRQQSRGA